MPSGENGVIMEIYVLQHWHKIFSRIRDGCSSASPGVSIPSQGSRSAVILYIVYCLAPSLVVDFFVAL
jgi:hypothetical protein